MIQFNDWEGPSAPNFSHFKDFCICCEQSGKEMNKEHFYPQWLLRRTKTQKDLFSSPYGEIPADQITVRLCKDCNSKLGKELESPVSKVFDCIESGKGFNDYEAELLIRWMWKITGVFYWSICNDRWKYGAITLKERVLSRISYPRDRLALAISLIHDSEENFGCAPVGLDVFPLFSNVYAAGVFSKLCLVVLYSSYMREVEKEGWTVYRLNNSPNVLNLEKRIIPAVGFQTSREAVAYVKRNFGNGSAICKEHEVIALQVLTAKG